MNFEEHLLDGKTYQQLTEQEAKAMMADTLQMLDDLVEHYKE